MPTVSVILPTYNRDRTIERAVNSVLNQNYRDLELIVVDDASTDETEPLIKNYMLSDNRVQYLKLRKNEGQSRARNIGIKHASGNYIAFQDSDDEWLPEKLGLQVQKLNELSDDVGVTYCFMLYVSDERECILYEKRIFPDEQDLFKKGLMYIFRGIGIVSCIFRRQVFDVCGFFDEKLRALEDMDLLIRVSKAYKFYCIDEPLVRYFHDAHGVSRNKDQNLDAAIRIFRKYNDDIIKDPGIRAVQYQRLGKELAKTGHRIRAKRMKLSAWIYGMLSRFG